MIPVNSYVAVTAVQASSHQARPPSRACWANVLSRTARLLGLLLQSLRRLYSKNSRFPLSDHHCSALRSSPNTPGTLNMCSSVACEQHSDGGAGNSQHGSMLRSDRALEHLTGARDTGRHRRWQPRHRTRARNEQTLLYKHGYACVKVYGNDVSHCTCKNDPSQSEIVAVRHRA